MIEIIERVAGQSSETALTHFSRARLELQKAKTIDEVRAVLDAAERLRLYLRQVDESLEMQNDAAEIKLRAERRAGEMLKEGAEKGSRDQGKGGNRKSQSHDVTVKPATLDEIGISKMQSSRWQAIASIPESEFEQAIQETKEAGGELTEAEMLRVAKGERRESAPHVSHNSGNNEWYTPQEYIQGARDVMGGIDTDPASSDAANAIVRAGQFYTASDDGLSKEWRGRVWMNPPYAGELIGKFTSKLCQHIESGDVSEAVVLVNNATETGWFQEMAVHAAAVCFPRGRVKFWHPEKESAPLQGQALLYLGPNRERFIEVFAGFGFIGCL